MAGPETHTSRAINACLTCRKQKRKCTKERPRCFVCRKTGRACDYTPIGRRSATATDTIGSPDPEETGENVSLASRSAHPSGYEKSAMSAGSSTTNGLFTLFLDSEVSPDRSYLESNTRITLPPEYLPYLRSPAQVRHEVDVYLNSVHTFFPIVSKLRLYQQLSNADRINEPDFGLLLIAMQLHSRPCSEVDSSEAELYRSAKACHVYVESSNIFSIKVLQALLLIALYEISNSIYPAAYLTVGHCARLGHAMGVHQRSDAPQMLNRVGSGVLKNAAHVLSRVLGHLNDRNADVDFRYEEAMQLHRTAQALSHTLSQELEEWIEKVRISVNSSEVWRSLLTATDKDTRATI
ncbi:hypothetical protein APSETT444_007741 [Aspergillus pseudonomiae]